jgi:succinate-semialdehyde dehydrogenase/glutarate-semialdehyde dehydrogenase
MSIQSINSATGEVLENFSETTSAEIERILESGYLTFEQWRHRPFPERSKRMRQAAQILRNGKEKYARMVALEMGKPIVQGESEVEKCAWCCDYYAENAATFLAERAREPMHHTATFVSIR